MSCGFLPVAVVFALLDVNERCATANEDLFVNLRAILRRSEPRSTCSVSSV